MDNWSPFDADTAFPNALDFTDDLDQTLLGELCRNGANVEHPLATLPQGPPQPQFSSGDIGPQLNYPTTLSNGNMDTVVNPAFGAAVGQNSLMSSPWDSGLQQGYNNAFAVDASLWASTTFGADLPIHSDVAWGPSAWATPLGALGAHVPSNLLAEPSSGAANALAGAGRPLTHRPIYEQRDSKFHCIIQPCNRSAFSRLADLQRHQNAYHFGHVTFWCSATGCNRSRSHPYGRAFPRKDKRNDHEKKVHGGVLSVD